MQINDELIDRLAMLSKLKFEGAQKEAVKQDLDKMLAFVAQLESVDTTGVAPLIHMNDAVNVLRKDEAALNITKAEALKNAPQKDSDYFKVPRVLKK